MRLARRLRSERGFTLIELLVAMTAGIVVLMAALTILDVTMQQTTRSFSMVDATNRARPALEEVENQLHSSCFADDETPIQSGSTGTSLVFLTAYGDGTSPTATWNQIQFSGGNLTESVYSTTESEVDDLPVWSQGTLQSTRILLTNVAEEQNGGTTVPVFQYFAYQQASGTDAAGNNYMILPDGISPVPGTSTTVYNPLVTGTTALTSAQAQSAAEVLITLAVGPAGHANENTNLGVTDTVTDAVVLRFTPAANNTGEGGSFGPCE
jgi:prepilin-type N-terminal cleavage/methylation domain-containing protein